MIELSPNQLNEAETYVNQIYSGTKDILPKWTNEETSEFLKQSGLRDQQIKIERLEKEVFLLKMKLSHYQNSSRLNNETIKNIDFNIQNDSIKHELSEKQMTIWKAAKVLKMFASEIEHLQNELNGSDEWRSQNQQQLFRFHFSELVANNEQLKLQLINLETEMRVKDQKLNAINRKLQSTITLNGYLEKKIRTYERIFDTSRTNYEKLLNVWAATNSEVILLKKCLAKSKRQYNSLSRDYKTIQYKMLDLQTKSADPSQIIENLKLRLLRMTVNWPKPYQLMNLCVKPPGSNMDRDQKLNCSWPSAVVEDFIRSVWENLKIFLAKIPLYN